MKRHTLILLVISMFLPYIVTAQNDVKQRADEAYSHEQYAEATQLYEVILAGGVESHEVYYNLGCAYYRQDELAKAIVNYERALRLKPIDSDTRENLALCYAQTQDHIEAVPQLFFVRWWHQFVSSLTVTWWLVLLLCMVALLMAAVAWFMLSRSLRHRRLSLACSGLAVLLVALTVGCVLQSHADANSGDAAIVMLPMVGVKGEPMQGAADKFVLHEGTKVSMMEQQDQWCRIRIADGNNGWVESTQIEII